MPLNFYRYYLILLPCHNLFKNVVFKVETEPKKADFQVFKVITNYPFNFQRLLLTVIFSLKRFLGIDRPYRLHFKHTN